jgi:hypothetical protein
MGQRPGEAVIGVPTGIEGSATEGAAAIGGEIQGGAQAT